MSNSSRISPLMKELSGYMAGALKRKLPAEVAERAKIHLVDTFAAMISGSRLLPGKRVIAYIKLFGGTREAGVIGTRIVTTSLHAALANGIFGHADETDDVHAATRSHPSVSIVPTALAIAERQQCSGAAMLRAMVLGYDINARVLLSLNHVHMTRSGHHTGAKGGLFGSAAAAAALIKLNARQMRYVVSYCAEQAAGLFTLFRDTQHIEKAFVNGGMPAHNAVAAALMVGTGFTGVEDVLSGEPNFLSIFSPDADRDALVHGLGKEYEILRGGIKYWPAGAPIQAPLHVLRDLMQQHGFKADEVEKLTVRMPDKQLEVVDKRDMASITVQHLLAVMLLDGGLTFATAHDHKRINDPQVIKLRQKRIEAVGDGSTENLRHWRCAMEIILKDGRKLTHHTTAAKGSLGNPLTRQEVAEKAFDLMAPILGKKRSQTLMSALFDLERLKDVRELRRLYMA